MAYRYYKDQFHLLRKTRSKYSTRTKLPSPQTINVPAVRKKFEGKRIPSEKEFLSNAEFACKIVFAGWHRDHRTGGTIKRSDREKIVDVMSGKIAESVVCEALREIGVEVSDPDRSVFGKGKWDDGDLTAVSKFGKELRISVKVTKSFGQMLFLEKDDWGPYGNYLPGTDEKRVGTLVRKATDERGRFIAGRLTTDEKAEMGLCDRTYVVRIASEFYDALNEAVRIATEDSGFDAEKFIEAVRPVRNKCFCEVSGYLFQAELSRVIQEGHMIEKGERFGERTVMDASNYYVHIADLWPFAGMPA